MLPPLLSANTTYVYAVINFYVNAYCLMTDSQNFGTNIWNDIPAQVKTEWNQFIVISLSFSLAPRALTRQWVETVLKLSWATLHIPSVPTGMFEFDKLFKLRPLLDKYT